MCSLSDRPSAEPDAFKRSQFAKDFIDPDLDPETSQFPSWHDFIAYERERRLRQDAAPGVDAACDCVLDEHHKVSTAGFPRCSLPLGNSQCPSPCPVFMRSRGVPWHV